MGLIKDKLAKRVPIGYGFIASDPARDYDQAFELARNYPDDMPSLVIKTGKTGDVYPYTIYVSEKYFGNKNATKNLRKVFNR